MSLTRFVIDRAVGLLGWVRQGRRLSRLPATARGQVCVNLGCGLAVAPGWINVDASLNALFGGAPLPLLHLLYRLSGASRYYSRDDYCRLLREHHFVFHDLARSLPFPARSVDCYFSSHFFEHLFQADAARLLRDMHASLKDGGLVRIAVPDLAFAVALYCKGEKTRMLDDYFFVNDLSSFLARHKYMYDFELLGGLLREAGFREIRQCHYREGAVPDLHLLDNRPEETLFVEARR